MFPLNIDIENMTTAQARNLKYFPQVFDIFNKILKQTDKFSVSVIYTESVSVLLVKKSNSVRSLLRKPYRSYNYAKSKFPNFQLL